MCPPPSPFTASRSDRAPILCYVTDRRSLHCAPSEKHQELLKIIASAAEAGVDWIQIREKDLSGRELSLLTREAIRRAKNVSGQNFSMPSASIPRILVNDRLDVAFAENAGGVHLGENSLPVDAVKQLLLHSAAAQRTPSLDFLVGASCHSLESAKAAALAGADYLIFGPIFATPSKQAFGSPQGLERLELVCRNVAVPVLAIGGITLENASTCLKAGAAGIAAIRLFQNSPNMKDVVGFLRQIQM